MPPLVVGFTGTRLGMTNEQKHTVRLLLESLRPQTVWHGDCVGADADFHSIVRAYYPGCRIVASPGPDEDQRAHCTADEILPVRSHFARNRAIVEACAILIATPGQMHELTFGGTWYTVRHARKVSRRTHIVWPDGTGLTEMRFK